MTAPVSLLPPFSVERVLEDIQHLSAEAFAGRRVGTVGHDLTREWLVARMQALDLHPTRFAFPLHSPVAEVYVPMQMFVAGHALQRRRDYSEHPRSADQPRSQTGRVVLWQADLSDWHDCWVRVEAVPRGPALMQLADQIQAVGGVGLLLPQAPTPSGYLVKRIPMGDPVAVPILTVRADLLPQLEGQQITAATPIRPQWPRGELVLGHVAGSDLTLAKTPLIVGAHYDGVGSDLGGPHFPCATDNAAGVAVVLEVARLLAEANIALRRPIMIIAFDAEEINAQGSLAYALHLTEQGVAPIVLNLDGAARWRGQLTLDLSADAEKLIAVLDQAGQQVAIPLAQGTVSSDNRRFAGIGFPAVGISGGFAGMHTPDDTIEQVEPEALARCGAFLLATLMHLDES